MVDIREIFACDFNEFEQNGRSQTADKKQQQQNWTNRLPNAPARWFCFFFSSFPFRSSFSVTLSNAVAITFNQCRYFSTLFNYIRMRCKLQRICTWIFRLRRQMLGSGANSAPKSIYCGLQYIFFSLLFMHVMILFFTKRGLILPSSQLSKSTRIWEI